MRTDAPAADVIEVSVFSRGHGEAIVVHVGHGRWILVDSFLMPNGEPVLPFYLGACGIDAGNAVDAVLFTHWHDDHVAGAARVAEICSKARIAVPGILFKPEFQMLLRDLDGAEERSTKSVREFARMMALLDKQERSPRFCCAERTIRSRERTPLYKFEALSPSDEDQTSMLHDLRAWLDLGVFRGRPDRNGAAVASVIDVGGELILLGSDLEIRGPRSGWQAAYADAWHERGRASVFKIPHHGSANAHHPPIWREMLMPNVHSVLTPWNLGAKLPTEADVRRIIEATPSAYAASPLRPGKKRRRGSMLQSRLRKLGYRPQGPNLEVGQVRLRKRSGATWTAEFSGGACNLIDLLSKSEEVQKRAFEAPEDEAV